MSLSVRWALAGHCYSMLMRAFCDTRSPTALAYMMADEELNRNVSAKLMLAAFPRRRQGDCFDLAAPSRPALQSPYSTPSDFSFRCSADRSMPMNSAVREMFPPKRL